MVCWQIAKYSTDGVHNDSYANTCVSDSPILSNHSRVECNEDIANDEEEVSDNENNNNDDDGNDEFELNDEFVSCENRQTEVNEFQENENVPQNSSYLMYCKLNDCDFIDNVSPLHFKDSCNTNNGFSQSPNTLSVGSDATDYGDYQNDSDIGSHSATSLPDLRLVAVVVVSLPYYFLLILLLIGMILV